MQRPGSLRLPRLLMIAMSESTAMLSVSVCACVGVGVCVCSNHLMHVSRS